MKCKVENCLKEKILAQGMCSQHYSRWYRYGDVTVNHKPNGVLDEAARAKISKTLTGRIGPWAGKKRGPHTAEWKQKQSQALLGVKKSVEHRAAIARARTGVECSSEVRAKISFARLGVSTVTEEGRRKISARHKGRNNAWFGKRPPALDVRGKWVDYNGTKMRSTYEARLAKLLDASGIEWKYEPKRFDLEDCTYLPDFFLPATGEYVEVKGWMRPEDQRRIDRFKEVHPGLLFNAVFGSDLKSMERFQMRIEKT